LAALLWRELSNPGQTLLGGSICGLALLQPGLPLTRHVVSASQMMISALLIQRTGRCIETHIQVFGSLGRV